jgi:hypothetical protein
MAQRITAIYEASVLRPVSPLELPQHSPTEAVIRFAGDVPECLGLSNGSAPGIDSAAGIGQDNRENRRCRSCL